MVLFNNVPPSPSIAVSNGAPRARPEVESSNAIRYTIAITRVRPRDTSLFPHNIRGPSHSVCFPPPLFFSGETCFSVTFGLIPFISLLSRGRSFLVFVSGENLRASHVSRKIVAPRSRLIFSRDKGGLSPSESLHRVDSGTRRDTTPPCVRTRARAHTHARSRVSAYVSYTRRFGTSVGAEKLSKAKLTWPARTPPSCLPQLRARRMCFQHDRKYFLFVRVHGTSSIRLPLKIALCRTRFPPGALRVGRIRRVYKDRRAIIR